MDPDCVWLDTTQTVRGGERRSMTLSGMDFPPSWTAPVSSSTDPRPVMPIQPCEQGDERLLQAGHTLP
ncbi:hypothetical protein TRAPUB_5518 [Trametes pubescens]|uniref:Uncharacterized protein n=1 Tax=Trametes pubescens TaxID=154538 RepID=A0A1M2V897_TRAPU|nr:hypothetical protein TRAPUB_5518 [Trametes pubescens]